MGLRDVHRAGRARRQRDDGMGARFWVPARPVGVCQDGRSRGPGDPSVAQAAPLPVGCHDVSGCGPQRPPRRAPVGAHHGCGWDERVCDEAAAGGHLNVLQWAVADGCGWSRSASYSAATNGHLDVLVWIKDNISYGYDRLVCTDAAANGHDHVVEWAHANGFLWDDNTCAKAARQGIVRLMALARQAGCVWDEYICEVAAEYGHIAALAWARENGCPWDERTCRAALYHGHVSVLKWARDNGCPWYSDTRFFAGIFYGDQVPEWRLPLLRSCCA